jgi:hypothetical protein
VQKTNEEKMIACVHNRTIDANGNHIHHEEDNVWGWDDPAMNQNDKKYATIVKSCKTLKRG